MLALGGHQSSALAIVGAGQAALGPYLGDLAELPTRERFIVETRSYSELYRCQVQRLVHDLHPDYFTTQWAKAFVLNRLAIQHHHAHIVATMLEHGWLDRTVLGVALDGTGYGPDGTIWGGEFLRCTASQFRRVGRLRPFRLAGGEAAIREPWRVAVTLVEQALGREAALRLYSATIGWRKIEDVLELATRTRLSPLTSSVGRLFDGVAALVLGINEAHYEAQPAMLLEAACNVADEGQYDFALHEGALVELDWRPVVARLVIDRAAGVSPNILAMRFHRSLARAIAQLALRFPAYPVALGGGVFQNRYLLELLREEWATREVEVAWPGLIPPGDGGLAAGQLAVAVARIREEAAQACV